MPDFRITRFGGLDATATTDSLAPGSARLGQNFALTKAGGDGGRALRPAYGASRLYASSLRETDADAVMVYGEEPSILNASAGAILFVADHSQGGRVTTIHQHADMAEVAYQPPVAEGQDIYAQEAEGYLLKFDFDSREWTRLDATGDVFPDNSDPVYTGSNDFQIVDGTSFSVGEHVFVVGLVDLPA